MTAVNVAYFEYVVCNRCGLKCPPHKNDGWSDTRPAGWMPIEMKINGRQIYFDMCPSCADKPIAMSELASWTVSTPF